MRQPLLFLLFIFSYCNLVSQSIQGTVFDKQTKETLPFANIVVMNSSIGTYCDEKGNFSIKLESTQSILVVSLLGYESKKVAVDTRKDETVKIMLKPIEFELEGATVQGKKENVGKTIMKKVIANKKQVLSNDLKYSADSYYRTSMEKWIEKSKKDTVEIEEGFQPVYLNENFARQHYFGNKTKREVKAELKQTGDNALKQGGRMAIDNSFRGNNLWVQYNPLEYFRNPLDANIDLYENQLQNASLSDLPITSPLSDNAFLSYQYKLTDIENVEGDTIFTIQVKPIFKQAPLFSGQLKIKKDGYLLQNANLEIRSSALTLAKNFELDILYEKVTPNHWRPTQRYIRYEAKNNGSRYKIETIVKESKFDFAPKFDKDFFNNEVIVYDLNALERDTSIWKELRPTDMKLNVQQKKFVSEQDSIWRYEHSPEYYRIQDSIFNHNTLLDIFVEGMGWKRRTKGITLYFNSVLESVRFLSVGGYRQALGGSIEKEFLSNSNVLDIDYEINYGFQTKDWKGELQVGYMYLPRRFSRAYVKVKNQYELITTNTSLQAVLSSSNFVENVGFGAGHSFEISNGVYLTTAFEYADKKPLTALDVTEGATEVFGEELAAPVEFERYRALFLEAELLFNFDQQYITRGSQKIVLGSKYPTLKIKYRKGVPNIWQSEVAFDQLELELYDRMRTKFGDSNWNVQAGGFVNQKNLRVIEHRFFRGETPFFFVDPLASFQLLPTTFSTPNAYIKGGFMHHFNGYILDKIPLLNQLQMELLAGGGFMTIPSDDFIHGELFAGLGKKFRLFGNQVQVAIYGVTADNNLEKANITYKIGFNSFNAFAREWQY